MATAKEAIQEDTPTPDDFFFRPGKLAIPTPHRYGEMASYPLGRNFQVTDSIGSYRPGGRVSSRLRPAVAEQPPLRDAEQEPADAAHQLRVQERPREHVASSAKAPPFRVFFCDPLKKGA